MAEFEGETVLARPAPGLRSMVDRYIGYRQNGVTLGVHRGLPSRSITLVISLAGPITLIGGPGTEHGHLASHTVVGGLHLAPSLIQQDAYQEGLHLCLNPLGVRRLLGVSATELSSTTCDLADLPVRWGRHLADRLRAATDWQTRFAVLDAELSKGTTGQVTLVSEIQWAWQKLVSGSGTTRIAELADEVGWSRRHFGQRFAHAVGVSPKQAARLMRFERSTGLLRRGRRLADVAVECGYYDQAHLTNEWREFAGCSPSTWIAEELPFLQDAGTGPPAESVP